MPKKTSKYTEEDVANAIEEIRDKKLSVKSVSSKYNIPRMTLARRLKGIGKTRCGPPPLLSEEEEALLEKWILECSKKGFPRRKTDLFISVKEMLLLSGRSNVFKNDLPADGWYRGFLSRHPVLALRTAEAVSHPSACVSQNDIRNWFTQIANTLKEENAFEVLNDPSRIFNGDESGFLLCPKTSTPVLAKKGSRNVLEIDAGQAKVSITAMFTFSATGVKVPPMVIFPYKRIPTEIVRSMPPDWGIGRSDSGWMKAEIFFEYIANIFTPFLEQNKVQRPVVLFVDGHKSHLTRQLSELCSDVGIILVALYPNATRMLQPADVSVFKPLKEFWKQEINNWKLKNPRQQLTKTHFAPILKKAFDKLKPETIMNGFMATGLFPWNPDAIDFERYLSHNKDPSEESETRMEVDEIETKSLTKSNFMDMAGIELIKSIEQREEKSSAEQCIEKIWNFFNDYDPMHVDDELVSSNVATEFHVTPKRYIIDNNFHEKPDAAASNNASVVSNNATDENETPNDTIDVENAADAISVENDDMKNTSCSVKRSLFDVEAISEDESPKPLYWPESPKRKGIRNVERWPFVVSSRQWKKFYDDKEQKKRLEAEEKEERKNQRLMKKKKKNDAAVSGRKTITGLCFKCALNVRVGYKCTSCGKIYHKKCIPKQFEENLPEEEDHEEFVCPECLFKDDDDDFEDEDFC